MENVYFYIYNVAYNYTNKVGIVCAKYYFKIST